MRLAIVIALLAACLEQAPPPVQSSGPVSSTELDGSFACLAGDVRAPPVCTVVDTQDRGTPNETETLVPSCSDGGVYPCWNVVPDAACAPSGFEIVIVRAEPAPDGVRVDVSCELTDRTAGT